MSERRRSPLAALLALALLAPALAPSPSAAQPAPEQTVWLKNGGFVRGALVELVPGDHVTLQLVTGEIRRLPAADIDRLGPGPASPPASAPPGPPPSAPLAPSATAPAPSAPSPLAPRSPQAVVRLTAPPHVELQARPRLDRGPWSPACTAPCDRPLVVVDREFRAAGADVHPSHTFVIEPGERPLRLEVDPGREALHRWGVRSFLVGTPIALLGGAGFGLGRVQDREPLAIGGIVTAIVGGALILTAIPLIYSGQTRVRTDKGDQIARRPAGPLF